MMSPSLVFAAAGRGDTVLNLARCLTACKPVSIEAFTIALNGSEFLMEDR